MKRNFESMKEETGVFNKEGEKIVVDELDKMDLDELTEEIQWEYEKYAAMDEDFGVEETKEGEDAYTFKEEKVWCDCQQQFSFRVCPVCFN